MPDPIAVRKDFPLVLLEEMTRDRKAQTQATVLARGAAIGLPEAIENVRQKFRLDTDAGIPHLDLDRITFCSAANLDAPALRRELDGVRDDIGQDLMQTLRIALDWWQLCHNPGEADVLAFRYG